MHDIWQEFIKIIREEVGTRVVETWFKAVNVARWDAYNKIIILQAPNKFVTDWLKTHYMTLFEHHLGRLLNEPKITVVFQQESDINVPILPATKSTPSSAVFTAAKPLTPPTKIAKHAEHRAHGEINARYIFESFVVGPNNNLAYSAAHAVAQNPGILYNPLFMYGGSGLGKTHLLHAIGNVVKSRNKKAHILYQSADRFVHEFINAIRFDKVFQFESKYKNIDLLLIDDIQFISHKEQTQEAFFHIFNVLHQAHKQIVCTSDSMPCDIAGLAERMRSRLEGGLVADIQMPKLETKIAIIKQKAELQGHVLTDDIAYAIASRVISNIRELEGALIRVIACASLAKQAITLDLIEKVLVRPDAQRMHAIDMQRIVNTVCQHFEYSLADMKSAKRQKELTSARHVALYLMKKLTRHSLKEIGNFLSRKDHTTVLNALERIEQRRETDHKLNSLLHKLEHDIVNA